MTHPSLRLFFCLSLSAAFSYAEPGASIAGTVKDPQGRPVPGVTLTMFSRSGAAGNLDHHRFEWTLPDGWSAGKRLSASRGCAWFSRCFWRKTFHLAAGAAMTRDIVLEIAGVHEQVVVTAASTPQAPEHVSRAVTVIDQQDADARDASAVSDVVALVPGCARATARAAGAFTTIQIRGLRDQDTAVVVDGLRLRDASATQADASGLIEDLMFTDASRVEVMRGSGSSLYGTNAIGGVINVITDEGGGRTRGSLLLEGGSSARFGDARNCSGGFLKDRIQYSLGLSDTDVTSGVGGDSPFRDVSTQGRVTFHFSPSIRLTARLFGADSFRQGPRRAGSDRIAHRVWNRQRDSAFSGVDQPLSERRAAFADEHRQPLRFIPALDNPDATRAARFITAALDSEWRGVAGARLYGELSGFLSNGRRYGDGPAGGRLSTGGQHPVAVRRRISNRECAGALSPGPFQSVERRL